MKKIFLLSFLFVLSLYAEEKVPTPTDSLAAIPTEIACECYPPIKIHSGQMQQQLSNILSIECTDKEAQNRAFFIGFTGDPKTNLRTSMILTAYSTFAKLQLIWPYEPEESCASKAPGKNFQEPTHVILESVK